MKQGQSKFVVWCLAAGAVVLAACGGGTEPQTQPVSVGVTPATATLHSVGATQQFTATAQDAAGNSVSGVGFTWTSSNSSVATVNASGLATAVADGTVTITASAGGSKVGTPVTGSATLIVQTQPTSVVVTPGAATLDAVDATQQYSAVAKDAAGNDVAGATFKWASSNMGVATVSASGLVTAVANGSAQITATVTGTAVSGSGAVTVAQALASIEVTPDVPTITGVGATQQFNAVGKDANGYDVDPQPATFTWASDDELVATVDANGLATAVAKGGAQISATSGAVSGTADLTVQGILVWIDFIAGTNAVPGALDSLGLTASMAADSTPFVDSLQLGGWGLVIFGEQQYERFIGTVQTELMNYVAGGGRLLAASWRVALPAFMEATVSGTNFTTMNTDAHAIFAGLPASISLTNPSYGIYSQAYSATGSAQCIGTTNLGFCAAILGNTDHTLLLGPFFDTYATASEGERLVANSIKFLLAATPPPAVIAGRPAGGDVVQTERTQTTTAPRPQNVRKRN